MLSSYYQGASLKLTYSSNETWKLNVVSYLELSSISNFHFLDLVPQFVLMRIWTLLSGLSDTLNFLASLIHLC